MKTFMLLFWVLIGGSLLAQEPYRYLEVVIEKDVAWVKILPEPKADKTWLENNSIKAVNFNRFVAVEPTITQPEGFFLCAELDDFKQVSKNLGRPSFLNSVSSEAVSALAKNLARQLFGCSLDNLERDRYFMLWLSLTRAVMKTNNRGMYLDKKDKATQVALTGEWVWNLIDRSWTVQDVRVFSCHNPDAFSTNILVDSGGNIMTKIMICPELHYKKRFSYDLVDKSSKGLKNFACVKSSYK
jgi:hypothetical protein